MNIKKLFGIRKHEKITTRKIEKIKKLERKKFHPILHHAHKKHRMSYKTLYYIKSYGKEMHVWHAILKQSLLVIMFASIVSTFGGLWLESMQAKLTMLVSLLIMIPALNDMTGDLGTILSSKFSTYLFTGKVNKKWWKAFKVRELTFTVFTIAIFAAVYIAVVSSAIALLNGFALSWSFFLRMAMLSVFCTVLLTALLTIISFAGGYIIFKRGDDPNNFLIPITTAVADFACLGIFSWAVTAMF
jgi:cation transporter-like permease